MAENDTHIQKGEVDSMAEVIAELEADVLKKHVMAGKLADESAHQKRRIFELEAALSDLVTSIVPQEINSVEYGRYKTLACSSPNAAEKARAALTRKSHRWIPVSEDDPEEDMLVFVANMDASFKSITIGMFNGQRWRAWNGVGIYVTHWMSLPFPDWPEEGAAAPKEGE